MRQPKTLTDAVWEGDVDAVQALLAAGADPNEFEQDRYPAFFMAVDGLELAIVRLLLAAGARLDLKWNNWSVLVYSIDAESDAAWQANHEPNCESTEMTELLLSAGAVPDDEAFAIARQYENHKVLAVLERYSNRKVT